MALTLSKLLLAKLSSEAKEEIDTDLIVQLEACVKNVKTASDFNDMDTLTVFFMIIPPQKRADVVAKRCQSATRLQGGLWGTELHCRGGWDASPEGVFIELRSVLDKLG